ncbi:MAG: FAD-dependent oxidoreductase [Pseudomonadales bacterium]|nr:FAD-dependent oxidoreductase [Pseudomonadales bacterium]
MNATTQSCLIIGASHAGSQLALQLRKEGWQGSITLVGEERHLPYHRPPLSKAVLAGDKQLEDVLLRPAAMYANNQIEFRPGERVTAIHRAQHLVELENGELLAYDRLALCTGAQLITLPLGEGLDNVFYLRTADDALAIRKRLSAGQKAVIIGAGYIGLETAAVLNQHGLEVTVLEREQRVLQRVTGEEIAAWFTALHRSHGVNIVCQAEVTGISGAGRAERVLCADGSQYPADLVIIGVGVRPRTGLAAACGLQIDNGIAVDEFAQTSDPDIFAAGDCTSHPSALYGRRIRLESVQNANDQARTAAASICGKSQPYHAQPWFWSDQYAAKLQSVGLSEGYDAVLLRGEPGQSDAAGFSVFYGREGRLIAADCINRAREFMVCKQLLQSGAALSARFADESQPLSVQETG